MCGFTGLLAMGDEQLRGDTAGIIAAMAATLTHRGPDDSGQWIEPEGRVALGFRRLAIIDLSPAGHQPMTSASGRYVIVFNGEVYNFAAIRKELEDKGLAPSFRGHSDTEVILAAVEAWGLEESLKRFVGMFAFALWDRREHRLRLVRDRVGVKPLYYGVSHGVLLFGSELKALRAFPRFDSEVDRDVLALFLRHAYIPEPYSIFRDIHKLPCGTILDVHAASRELPVPTSYWSARNVAEAGTRNRFTGTDADAEAELDALLREAIGLRMISDVPLGVFLSGGIDSSIVASVMQQLSARPVKTFTIGFNESGYDEARAAKEVAAHLGTDHAELYLTPDETLRVIPKLPALYDEPFADPSQIPMHLVSALARRDVTVALSGDGGDELFGGYNRYLWVQHLWRKLGWTPAFVRAGAARVATAVSPAAWERFFTASARFLPRAMRQRNPGDKIHKLAEVVAAATADEMYWRLTSTWKQPARVLLDVVEPQTVLTDRSRWAALPDVTERMMYLDLVTYLPDDILVKVDRASMGVSLEAREPLLDHRLIEFAWRLPMSMKIRNGEGKWLLRKVLYRYVPQSLVDRPKMGFAVPIDAWLRGPLRSWAEELLDERRLRDEGFFDARRIRETWQEHLSGTRNWQYQLWTVLMFQAWLDNTRRVSSPVTAFRVAYA